MLKKIALGLVLTSFASVLVAAPITFAVPLQKLKTYQSVKARKVAYNQFAMALGDKVGVPVVVKFYKEPRIVANVIADNKADLAYLKFYDYKMAKKKHPDLQTLTVVRSWHSSYQALKTRYASDLVVLKDSPYNKIQDLKGKTLGLVRPDSQSGYYAPMKYMKSQKIQPKTYFKKVIIFPSHLKLLQAIAKHKIDGGFAWNALVDANSNLAKFKVIKRIGNLPNPFIVINSKTINKKLAKKIYEALHILPTHAYDGLSFVGVTKYLA